MARNKRNAAKSAQKSAPPGVPFQQGNDRRRGKGPPKGQGGRPPDEFKALCQELATRDLTVDAVKGILEDPSHGQFMAALKWATENGYGKPAQPIEGNPDKPLELRVRFDSLTAPIA